MALDRDAYEVLQVHPNADQAIIEAAYRILAAKWHPDRDPSPRATHRMAELNVAYAQVRTEDRRAVYDKQRTLAAKPSAIVPPTPARPPAQAAEAAAAHVLDFGRYAGWTLDQIAVQDPDYLRWLSRQVSGARYRRRIQVLLAQVEAKVGEQAAARRNDARQR